MSDNHEKKEEHGHGHGHGDKPAHDKPAKTTDVNSGGGHAQRGGPTFILIGLVAVVIGFFLYRSFKSRESAEATATFEQPARDEVEDPIRGVTPMKIRANYPFVLESDQPIKVTYGDGQSFIHRPGECVETPTPHSLDPKSFTDPNNKEGHLAFRLYRRQSNGVCP